MMSKWLFYMPSLSDSADLYLTAPDYSQHPNSFHKAHINTMLMPTVNKFWYLVPGMLHCHPWPNGTCFRRNEKTIGGLYLKIFSVDGVAIMEIVNMVPHCSCSWITCQIIQNQYIRISPELPSLMSGLNWKHFDIYKSLMRHATVNTQRG